MCVGGAQTFLFSWYNGLFTSMRKMRDEDAASIIILQHVAFYRLSLATSELYKPRHEREWQQSAE